MQVPTMSSVASPKGIGALVAREWGVAVRSCRLIHQRANDFYLVEHEGGSHVFRVSAARLTSDDVRYEVELVRHVVEGGASVSAPVASASDEWTVVLDAPEGPRVGVLWTDARGRFLNNDEAHLFGAELARFHVASDSFEPTVDRRVLDADYQVASRIDRIVEMLESHPDDREWFAGHAERVLDRLRRASGTALDVGPCHMDAHMWNANFVDGRAVLFDLEFCGPGPRVIDLAHFRRGGLLSPEEYSDTSWPDFLAGYESVRPVADADRELIDLYVAATSIWVLGLWASVENAEPLSTIHPTWWADRALKIAREFDPS